MKARRGRLRRAFRVLALAAAAGGSVAMAQGARVGTGRALPSGERPELVAEPDRVEVGEPFALSLVLADPGAADAGAPVLDASWVVLDEAVDPLVDGVRFRWTLASLEAGDRLVSFAPAGDLGQAPAPVRVRVAGVLAPDEAEPRPIRGLPGDFGRVTEAEADWPAWALVLAGALGALAVLGGLLLLRRWRSRPRAVLPPPGRLERLEALGAGGVDASERHHGWAALLREAVDARTGTGRAAWVEEDWLAAVAASPALPADLHARVAAVLRAAARVRFGGERPSAFAEEATAKEVRALLELLERPAGGSATPAGEQAA